MVDNPSARIFQYRDADPDEASFFWTGGPVEVGERTWFQSVMSGVTGFETDDGLVLVDTGTQAFSPSIAGLLRQETAAPVHTAVYTHGHLDHAFGLTSFLAPGQAAPRVVAHRALPGRLERYQATPTHNTAINIRQFGGAVPAAGERALFSAEAVPPDTLYDDTTTLEVGGVAFELHHCRGETDDHTWVYCPERGVLCPGDLFIYAVPNAGNPQKVQRYPWDWAAGLREMAACEPRSMCPGHGGPTVEDPAKVRRMLLETADYLDAVVGGTLAALEDGSPPHVDVVRRVEPPASDSPWLRPVYDEAEFIVRNVIRYYGGWWSGRPSELKPAPRAQVAREVAALAGGAAALARRSREVADTGDLRLACHLADYALEAAPSDAEVQRLAAAVYGERAEGETSLMATNIFASAAAYANEGRAFA